MRMIETVKVDDTMKSFNFLYFCLSDLVELSTLSLSKGCFGVPRALYKNTTVNVTLNLLDAQKKNKLALQICERLSCGRVLKHSTTATVHNGTCLANCILRDSKLHNCTTAAKGDCMNATEVICGESYEIFSEIFW